MKAKKLTKEQLAQYSQRTDQNLEFDLSRIPAKDFDLILNAIARYSKKHIVSLTFTLNFYFENYKGEYPNLNLDSDRIKVPRNVKMEPVILTESAYRKNPSIIDKLLNCLYMILPDAEMMRTLVFKAMILNKSQIEKIGESLNKNTSIKTVAFENCTLYDQGFSIIARSIKHLGITSFICRSCGVTDNSISTVKSLLSYHISIQKEAEWKASLEIDGTVSIICMTSVDLQNNLFSVRLLLELGDVLPDIPLTLLDIRGNQHIDEKIAMNMRRTVPHVDIKINSSQPKRKKKSAKSKKSPVSKTPKPKNESNSSIYYKSTGGSISYSTASSIQTPRKKRSNSTAKAKIVPEKRHNSFAEEIENTHREVEVAPNSSESHADEVMIAPGIKIVGERAVEFSEFLVQICNLSQELSRKSPKKEVSPKKKAKPKPKRSQSVKNNKGGK